MHCGDGWYQWNYAGQTNEEEDQLPATTLGSDERSHTAAIMSLPADRSWQCGRRTSSPEALTGWWTSPQCHKDALQSHLLTHLCHAWSSHKAGMALPLLSLTEIWVQAGGYLWVCRFYKYRENERGCVAFCFCCGTYPVYLQIFSRGFHQKRYF